MKVLVTGANGFIGAPACRALAAAGHAVHAVTRTGGAGGQAIGDIAAFEGWDALLPGIDAVVHLAALAHVPEGRVDATQARRVNVLATQALARAARAAGVRRFIHVSTIKVHGEASGREPFTPESPMAPASLYARLKAEAEQALQAEAGAQLQTVVLRPPLVYGPGVKANFLRLCEAVARGRPIPLPGRANLRSLLFVDNLADLLVRVLEHPKAAGRAFLPADGEPVSTVQLVRALGAALGRPARILTLPWPLLALGAALLGRRADLERVAGSLHLHDPRLAADLGWTPKYDLQQGLAMTAGWYRQHMP